MAVSFRQSAIITLLFLSLLATVPLLSGNFPAISDMRDVYIPLESFFQSQQQQWQLPAWQPLAAWGFPAIAAGQIGFFYPLLLLTRHLLPLSVYLPLNIIIHLFALSLGTFALARQYQQSKLAALFTSVTFTYGAFAWQHLIHLNIFLILPWLPWQLWYTHRLRSTPTLRPHQIITLGLLLGLPFLIGQFQIPTLIALVSVCHLLYLRWNHLTRHPIRSTILPLFLAATIAFGISAAQLLPTLELIPHSSRGDSTEQFDITRANQYSYPLYHLPTLLFPHFYDTGADYWGKRLEIEYGFFLGTIPLLLLVFWLRRHYRYGRNQDTFFVYLGLISFLLALGSLSPFRILGFEPSLWVFSAPARWLLFTCLAASFLAGRALDALFLNQAQWQRFLKISLGTLVVVISLANITLFAPQTIAFATATLESLDLNTPYNHQKIISVLTSAQTSSLSLHSPFTYLPLAAIATLLLLRRRQTSTQQLAIVAITIAEIFLINTGVHRYRPWSQIFSPPTVLEQLPDSVTTNQARIYSLRPDTDTGAYFTNPDSRSGTENDTLHAELLTPLAHTQFNIAGVEWPASLDFANQDPALSSIRESDAYDSIDVTLAQSLNIGAIIAPTSFNLLQLQSDTTQSRGSSETITYHLNPTPRLTLENNQGQPVGNITNQSFQSNGTITLTSSSEQNAQLIIRDTFYPGWQATINNQPATLDPHPPFFRQLPVPAGQHDIAITYHPQSVYYGISITIATAVICLSIVAFTNRRAGDTLQS